MGAVLVGGDTCVLGTVLKLQVLEAQGSVGNPVLVRGQLEAAVTGVQGLLVLIPGQCGLGVTNGLALQHQRVALHQVLGLVKVVYIRLGCGNESINE